MSKQKASNELAVLLCNRCGGLRETVTYWHCARRWGLAEVCKPARPLPAPRLLRAPTGQVPLRPWHFQHPMLWSSSSPQDLDSEADAAARTSSSRSRRLTIRDGTAVPACSPSLPCELDYLGDLEHVDFHVPCLSRERAAARRIMPRRRAQQNSTDTWQARKGPETKTPKICQCR